MSMFGGLCSILVGIFYILVGLSHFMMPRAQLRGATGVKAEFFESLAKSSRIFQIHYWFVAILSLLAIAVMLSLLDILIQGSTDILYWATAIGVLGAFLSIADFASVAIRAPRLAKQYVDSSTSLKDIIIVTGVPHPDPCFLALGLMGIWGIAVNSIALQSGFLPLILGCLGIAGGILSLLAFFGAIFRSPLLVDIAVGLGGLVIGPIWFIWVGMILMGTA